MSAPPATALRLFAPAKFNPYLAVRRRRPDGFHDLDTIFQALNWGDELRCRPLDQDVCRIACDHPGVPLGPGNLIARAWERLRAAFPGRVGGLAVDLIKRIPPGAGLGGGSADAAATLVALNRLYRLRLPAHALEELAADLGSDCPFFIRGGTQVGSGRGEQLRPIRNRLPPRWIVGVWPGFPSSTAAAYRRITPADWHDGHGLAAAIDAIERGDWIALQKCMYNTFSTLVSDTDLRYNTLREEISAHGLTHPLLAGSGSSIVAFAASHAAASAAARRLAGGSRVVFISRFRRRGVGLLAPRRSGL